MKADIGIILFGLIQYETTMLWVATLSVAEISTTTVNMINISSLSNHRSRYTNGSGT